jgi:hypothetical protein
MRKSISIVHKYFLSGCDIDSAPNIAQEIASAIESDSKIKSAD